MSMTKSDAIKFLSRYVGNDYYTPQCQQAHRMAIEALEERERATMGTREKLVVLLDRFVDDEWFASEEIADELIAHGVTVATDNNVGCGWIPVTERLPEESGQYIVCCDDSGCSYGEGIWYRPGVVVCALEWLQQPAEQPASDPDEDKQYSGLIEEE